MRKSILVLFLALGLWVSAQTPGQIFRTAVNDSLLDPNGDGWISNTTSGFSDVPIIQDESEEFETSWNLLWHYELEPSSDLQTGSACGPTEIVDNPNTLEHAAYWQIHDPDGIAGNEDELLLFRMRLNSDPNNAAYGYSFLIDTDQKFGSSGVDADPNALSGNPGFEYEILFASGNSGGVFVQDVDGIAAHNQITTLQTYGEGVNDQRSYARFSNCSGATPVFIDFFIAFADLGPAVTSNTTLRMLFASASSANSALNGSASDIGGVNDSNYPDDDSIFDAYITAVPTIQFSVGYSIVDVDGDNVDDATDNCIDTNACNYDGSVNNVACQYSDACGVCGGTGPSTWYADDDGDGLGDSGDSQSACTQPVGYVADSSDLCDDNTACNYDANSVANAVCTYATTWYADDDGDGWGDSGDSQSACTQPVGYVADNSDACDDLAATNFNDPGNAPCIYAAPTFTGLDSLWACEAQGNVTMDLDTMHAGTGNWSYSVLTDIVGFASSSITDNIIEFDFSASGTGRDTVEISGTNGVNTASIEIIVQESLYPYYNSISSDGVSNPGVSDGGSIFSFNGNHNLGVTVHYYKDAVMIIDGGVNKFMGYGEEFTLTSDANGNWTNLPTDAVWISGFTNAFGCYSPEPATSSTPTANPKIRQMPIPHLVD